MDYSPLLDALREQARPNCATEFLALRSGHVLWHESRISIEQVFRQEEILKSTNTRPAKLPFRYARPCRNFEEVSAAEPVRQGRRLGLRFAGLERQAAGTEGRTECS